jgi:putative tryptophan/tyrosine transport system substrate-binding protein
MVCALSRLGRAMRRRDFLTRAATAAAVAPTLRPRAARAQVEGKIWRIGFLALSRRENSAYQHAGFEQGMGGLGYVEGKDFVSVLRFADGHDERLLELAAELIRLRADVLLAGPRPAIRALQQATYTIPIVGVAMTDPVGNGLIASLARPGGNLTGSASSSDDTSEKQLELLAAVVPKPSRIGFLRNPGDPDGFQILKVAQDSAEKAGVSLVPVEAPGPEGIENAFEALGRGRVQAVIVPPDGLFAAQRKPIAEHALRHRLPTMFTQREFVDAGGLMSYGESYFEFWQRSATFVHKIMHGAKPADLPVEQPTRFHLVINRKTADALGVTIPPLLLILADEVIE